MSKATASYTVARIEDGNGISDTSYSFMATSTDSVPSASSSSWTDWSTAYTSYGSTNRFLWQRETITYTKENPVQNVWLISTYGDAGTPANVLDFNATGLTYVSNLRVNSHTEIKVTADLQGSYTSGTLYTEKYDGSSWVSANIIYYDTTSHDPMISQSSVSNASEVTLRIAMTESAQFRIRLVSSSDTVIKEISPIDGTEYDHDWGSVDELPVSYLDRSGNTCTPLNGDYFVARIDFEMSPVTPQAGDNPQENGWYVRYGTSEPYTYEKTTNTTVVSGKTYYDYAHKKGVPYTLSNNSWIELTVSNPNDAEKALNILGSVLNDPSIQPSMKTLYMWVKNLMALEATIESLFSRTITLLTNGVFKSSTLTYDPDDNRFVTDGFVLDYTGDVKLGKAFLRDIKLKCSDSQSKILLETQEHQDGMSAFNPIDTSTSARWCTNDIPTSSFSLTNNCTFNSVSRLISFSNRRLLSILHSTSGQITYNFYAPFTGTYYAQINPGGSKIPYVVNDTRGNQYFSGNSGYFSCYAGDLIAVHNMGDFYLFDASYDSSRFFIYSKTTSSSTTLSEETYSLVDTLLLDTYPTDTLVIGNSFNSSSNLDYKLVSSTFIQFDDGEIKCENNSYITVDGTTYSNLTHITKTASQLTFYNGSTSVSLSYPRDTSNRAKTGWSKCSGGSIDPVGQDSALITYNIYPSEKNTCYIGTQDNKFASAYINTINSTTVNGTHVGNVNSSGTSYSVYGAVFN